LADNTPSVWERLRLALRFFNQGWPGVAPSTKAAPYIWPTWRAGQPQWSIIDEQNYIDEGWELNAVIYSAIMFKVRSMQLAPLRAYHGTHDDPEVLPPERPLARLCKRPNAFQSWEVFQGQGEVYLNLLGNDFIFLDRQNAPQQGIPAAMYHLRSDRVTIIPDRTKPILKGYVYVPEGKTWEDGIPILPEDLIHIKLPNPGDPLAGMGWGLSPVVPMAQTADVDNDITRYLKMFFQSGAMPAGLLSTDESYLDEMDIARMRERWLEKYGGVDNWTDPVIMEKGMKYQQVGLSFDEMGFEALDGRNESRIAAPFGVPLILLETRGALSAATYTNKAEARKMFWQDTMVPEMRLFESEYQYYLNPEDGSFVMFDTSKVPALQQDIAQLVEAAYKLWSMGEPRNKAYGIVGLPVQDVDPTGDVGYLPINVMPVLGTVAAPMIDVTPDKPQIESGDTESTESGDTEAGSPAAEEDEEEERQEGKGWTLDAKAQHWKRFDRIAQSWERKFADAAADVFEKEKRDLLALLSVVKQKAQQEKATVNWSTYDEEVMDYLRQAGDDWRSAFLPLVKGVVTAQGEEWAAMLGMQFNVQNLEAIGWFDGYLIDFAQPIMDTTNKDIVDMLQTAQREGWSIPDMQKSMAQLFDTYIKNERVDCRAENLTAWQKWFCDRQPAYRTEMIARTETMRSSNAGTERLYADWGIKKKEWLSTLDNRVRTLENTGGKTDHRIVNGQVRAVQDSFTVGGEQLRYPGDPSGQPWNTINCRCTTIPVLEEVE